MKHIKQSLIIILVVFIFHVSESSSDVQHAYLYRGARSCKKVAVTEHSTFHISLWVLMFLMMFACLSCLVLLGLIKGTMGLLCCPPIGMWGLGTLVDLPRPLEHYQERELADTPVQYDKTGWPIHPETGKRSVRALTKKTEFYLNIIFFLTYPLAIIVTVCGACCFKDDPENENQHYKCVNTIVFSECAENPVIYNELEKKDIYADEDSAEDQDTRYVVYQMHCSQQSLRQETS